MSAKLDTLEARVKELFPDLAVERLSDAVILHVGPAQLVAAMTRLRDDAVCDFKLLIDIAGVHWPERAQEFDVVYQLLSVYQNHRLRVKVALDAATPLPSVTGVWSSANWYEREVYEMFGILVSGHPDLRRLLTDYDFDHFPLRKDFPVTGYTEMRWDEKEGRVVREPIRLTRENRPFYGPARA